MNRESKGFTIIELLLAMTFIAVLLLTVALTVIQIGNIYNKGLTLRMVDQSARTITADMRRTIGQSQPFATATNFVQMKDGDDVVGGRLCTGKYTYVWNYGISIKSNSQVNVYSPDDNPNDEKIGFARINDKNGKYCLQENRGTAISRANATELLSVKGGGDLTIAIHGLDIERTSVNLSTSQALYRIQMVIGTNDQDAITILVDSVDGACKPPSDALSQQDYCAVNKFDFTVLAGGGGGS